MEDSFKVRVDRAFGSLQASSSTSVQPTSSSSSSLSSLWCLTDEEIERNKWLQDKVDLQKENDELIYRLKNPKPSSPFLQGFFAQPYTSNQSLESDIQELDDEEDDDDDADDDNENRQPEDHTNEEWNIRSSVGMDCTLDNEEEEDAFDKVAVGKEEPADRFYMKNVNDYDVDIDSTDELPTSFTDVTRDPRANHSAAKLRLKEDDESARKSGLQVSEGNIDQIVTESNQQLVMNEPPGSKAATQSVPDYVRNPSRYTHYTFDSMDNVDEESNRKAYMDLFNSLKGSAAMEIQDDVSADSVTSVIFTPRKKSSDVSMKESKVDGNERKKVVPASIADGDDVCMMDEDEPTVKSSTSLLKSGRRYRTKGTTDVE